MFLGMALFHIIFIHAAAEKVLSFFNFYIHYSYSSINTFKNNCNLFVHIIYLLNNIMRYCTGQHLREEEKIKFFMSGVVCFKI